MTFTPVIFKTYKSNLSTDEFISELRKYTREPYYDNLSNRRLDIKDQPGTMFLNEYDNMAFIYDVLVDREFITFKTFIKIKEIGPGCSVRAISFPSQSGIIYLLVTVGFFILGLYEILTGGSILFFTFSIVLYILLSFGTRSTCERHHKVLYTISQLKSYPNEK